MKKITLYLILFFGFAIQNGVLSQTTANSFYQKSGQTTTNQITHIRWGTNKNPLEGLTITWKNNSSNDLIRWGYTNAFEQGSFPGIARAGYEDTFFNYTFPIVNSDATIYYQLYDSQNNLWDPLRTFLTAPPITATTFSFIAIGDSRGGVDAWHAISNLAHSKQGDFAVFNGDIVSDAAIASQWNDWFDYGKDFIENNLVLHALGNHDALSVPNYLNNFELPKSNNAANTELYYKVDYGEAIFISLDSEIPDDIPQYNWLVATLQANVSKKWKVIYFHKPFFTMGPHTGEMDDYLTTWWKAFDDYGVDLILNGHDHMYERTKPMNRNVSTTTPVTAYGSLPSQGRCQVVCGGAGAGLTDGGTNWFIEKYKKNYNLCKFDVTPNTLCGTIFDENNTTIDAFCIDKTPLGIAPKGEVFYPLKIIPNPVVDVFKIAYSSPNTGELKITIYDINGKKISAKKAVKTLPEFSFEYDVSKLQSGVYTVEIEMGNQKDHALLVHK